MMKQRRRGVEVEEYPELDQLVLTEIEAMAEDFPRETSVRAQPLTGRVAVSGRRPDPGRTARGRVRQDRQTPITEEFADWNDEGPASAPADKDLLSGEEQQFIDRTVEWLRSQPN